MKFLKHGLHKWYDNVQKNRFMNNFAEAAMSYLVYSHRTKILHSCFYLNNMSRQSNRYSEQIFDSK